MCCCLWIAPMVAVTTSVPHPTLQRKARGKWFVGHREADDMTGDKHGWQIVFSLKCGNTPEWNMEPIR